MLQRIFLSRRFSSKIICSAYISFNEKFQQVKTENERRHSALDKHTALSALPQLVVEVCESYAAQRTTAHMAARSMFARADARDIGVKGGYQSQQYQRLLLDSYVAFLSECNRHLRQQAELNCGSMSYSSVATLVCRRDGQCSVVFPVDHCVNKNKPPQTPLTAKLNTLLNEIFASGSTFVECFTELDCLMDQFIAQGPFYLSSVSWLSQYFRSLTPSLLEFIPQLPNINDSSCFEQLVEDLDSLSEWKEFASRAILRISSPNTPSQVSSDAKETKCIGADAVMRVFITELRERVRKCKLLLVLFSLYSDSAQDRLSRDVCAALRDIYIPSVCVAYLFMYLTVFLSVYMLYL